MLVGYSKMYRKKKIQRDKLTMVIWSLVHGQVRPWSTDHGRTLPWSDFTIVIKPWSNSTMVKFDH